MFTVCFAVYASLVAVEPTEYKCSFQRKDNLDVMVAACKEIDKDPVATCEARRVGALKWFITVKHVSLEPRKPATLPAGQGKAVSK